MKGSSLIAAFTASAVGFTLTEASVEVPRLVLPSIEDRVVWDSFPPEAAEVWLALADREMAQEVPAFSDELFLEYSTTGSRQAYDQRHGACIRRYSALVLGELIQNEGRFLPAIEAATEGLLAERTWILSAHDSSLDGFYGRAPVVDLASSHRAMVLAITSVLLEPVLPPDLVTGMRDEVKDRVTEVYRAAAVSGEIPRGLWWMKTTNNWNAVCHNGVVVAALAIEEDEGKRLEIINGMNEYLPYFLDGFTDDGYCTEGLGYWNYGFGNFAMLSEFVLRATGGEVNWLDSGKMVAASLFPFRLELVEQTYPTFADGAVGTRPNPVLLDYLADRIEAVEEVHPNRSGLGGYGLTEVISFGLAGNAPPITEQATPIDPLRDAFTDAGILILRPGDSESRLSLAVKAGHNDEHHNHNDVGSMIVAVDRTHLVLDPGGEIYTSRTFSQDRYVSNVLNSYGHPVPRIGGTLQSAGAEFRGTIVSVEFSPDFDRVVMDLAPAYEIGALRQLSRVFGYSRDGEGSVSVTDTVSLASPEVFETALITYGRFEVTGPNTALLYQGDAALEVSWTSTPVALKVGFEEILENTPHGSHPTRIAFTTEAPVTESSISIEMKPTVSPVSYVVDLGALIPDENGSVRIQAEDFIAETGGQVMISGKVNADGVAFKNWDNEGHRLTWSVPVPADGLYALRVRYAHGVPELSFRTISWEGIDGTAEVAYPPTGGWSSYQDDWVEVFSGINGEPYLVELTKGTRELILTNSNGRSLNLDWIELVPVSR